MDRVLGNIAKNVLLVQKVSVLFIWRCVEYQAAKNIWMLTMKNTVLFIANVIILVVRESVFMERNPNAIYTVSANEVAVPDNQHSVQEDHKVSVTYTATANKVVAPTHQHSVQENQKVTV